MSADAVSVCSTQFMMALYYLFVRFELFEPSAKRVVQTQMPSCHNQHHTDSKSVVPGQIPSNALYGRYLEWVESSAIPRERNLGLCSQCSDDRGVAMCCEAGLAPLNSAFSAPRAGTLRPVRSTRTRCSRRSSGVPQSSVRTLLPSRRSQCWFRKYRKRV